MPVFPVPNWTHAGYHHDAKGGARYFTAPRANGRLHAATDLLAPVGAPIYAIADGYVRQRRYYFYTGTWAIEVVHPELQIVARYGEIHASRVVKNLAANTKVKAGDLIAYVGQLDSGSSMLHLEMYSMQAADPKVALTLRTRAGGRFQRSPHLIDGTSIVDGLLGHQAVVLAPNATGPGGGPHPATGPGAGPLTATGPGGGPHTATGPGGGPHPADAAASGGGSGPHTANSTPNEQHTRPTTVSPMQMHFVLRGG